MRLRFIRMAVRIFVFIAFCIGCNSSKTLNNVSAKRILEAAIQAKNERYRVSAREVIEKTSSPGRADYLNAPYNQDDAGRAIQALIRDGYISQLRQDLKLPNISGKYSVDLAIYDGWTKNAIYICDISMKPTFADISGEYSFDAWYVPALGGHKATARRGVLGGQVNDDGTVTLIYGAPRDLFGGTAATGRYEFSISGNRVKLTGSQPLLVGPKSMTLTGTGPGGLLSVPKFTYVLNHRFTSLVDPSSYALDGGAIQIDEVSDLVLTTETLAEGRFKWHADLNEVASAIINQTRVAGVGSVVFGKQPDGDWIVLYQTY